LLHLIIYILKILITGGSGFIGTNLVTKLLEYGHELCSIDIKKPQLNEHFNFWIEFDIRDAKSLRSILLQFKPEIIIHLAARTDLNISKSTDYSTNTIGTLNLVEAINCCVTVRSVYFASTMLVCRVGHIPSKHDDYSADTYYGKSKIESEQIVRSYLRHDCSFTIFRPTSLWGPWFSSPYGDFFNLVLKKYYIHPFKSDFLRNYGFILNCIDKLIYIIENNIKFDHNLFYLCDYNPMNTYDWANTISFLYHKKNIKTMNYRFFYPVALLGDFLTLFGIYFPFSSRRYRNMITSSVFNTEELRQKLCIEKYNLNEAVKITLNWLKK
jgi:GlcNAc-P-P-Und epimerase